eukprot:CAMPEP_0113272966 /NCGR_PEP_ID=MMETSP0008_2-20120614/23598_1 /TAXON_ID=97485 /ORGANISM="Prymnesium parvum" /LENGTH=173 /DNA_ID=CAMNT_0000122449 /DNA_START=73 /DNA_END=594 /DNA_ORIENTATION=- /assembly_acc=CAM_ASM_000153
MSRQLMHPERSVDSLGLNKALIPAESYGDRPFQHVFHFGRAVISEQSCQGRTGATFPDLCPRPPGTQVFQLLVRLVPPTAPKDDIFLAIDYLDEFVPVLLQKILEYLREFFRSIEQSAVNAHRGRLLRGQDNLLGIQPNHGHDPGVRRAIRPSQYVVVGSVQFVPALLQLVPK